MKEIVGREIAGRVKDGQILGVGTGSTVDAAIDAIAARVRSEGLRVSALTTSYQSAVTLGRSGIAVLDPLSYDGEVHWGFDGADEVDPRHRLIKGKGGAQLREKILAARCGEFVVIVDESKLVRRLGERTAVPVEVVPEALGRVTSDLGKLGASEVTLRSGLPGKHGPVISEAGNLILDARFPEIGDSLERDLKCLVGVVESGLFFSYATEVLVAGGDGVRSLEKAR